MININKITRDERFQCKTNNDYIHYFDENGRIYKNTDSIGGDWMFYKNVDGKTQTYTMVKPEGDETVYTDIRQADDSVNSTILLPTGDVISKTISADKKIKVNETGDVITQTIFSIDSLTNQEVMSSKKITQPSGLVKNSTFTTVYDGNNTHTNTKTKTTTTNSKITTLKEDYTNAIKTITTPEGRVLSSSYNKDNLLTTSISTGTLAPTYYEYDEKGRVTKETTSARVTTYTYDSKGNLSTVTNPKNETTSYTYDIMDRVVGITHPNGVHESYEYDFNANMTRLVTPTPSDFDFSYNGVDKRVSLTSPLGYQTSYTYNKNRKLTSISRPSGNTITNKYILGRLVSTTTPQGITNYTYLFADTIGSITNGLESINYTYDGELLTKLSQSGVLNQDISYTYNNDFLITSSTYANTTDNYTYDNDGLLTSSGAFTISRDTDNGYVTSVSDGVYTKTNSYNTYAELTSQSDNTFAYNLQRDNKGIISQKIETLNGIDTTYNYEYDSKVLFLLKIDPLF